MCVFLHIFCYVNFVLRWSSARLSVGPGNHCGCGCDGHGHGRGSAIEFWSGAANGICTNGAAAGFGRPGGSFPRTFPPGCAFRSIEIRPASGTRPRRPVCPRTRRRQSRAGCGPPRRCAADRTCRRHFRSRASRRTNRGCRRTPCRPGPTRGNGPLLFYSFLVVQRGRFLMKPN